jgi:two-component system sensor histidine kinase MprB
VRDHGTGVGDDELPQLFDRFFRGASERGRPGSGLGLALVRQVAETSGGSVGAENAPGGGLVVRLVLPMQVRVP